MNRGEIDMQVLPEDLEATRRTLCIDSPRFSEFNYHVAHRKSFVIMGLPAAWGSINEGWRVIELCAMRLTWRVIPARYEHAPGEDRTASVNSISSIPSPVYQWRKALRRNIPVKYSATRLNISWIAVELPKKPTAIFKPFGGMSQTELLMLLGILW